MLEIILNKAIVPLILMLIVFLLHKKGVLDVRPLLGIGYSYKKGRRTLKIRLFRFGGSKVYNFMLKKGKPITFHYDVVVEEGSLRLIVRTNGGDLFDRTFTENERGSMEIDPKYRLQSIVLKGHNNKGRCHCEFREKK